MSLGARELFHSNFLAFILESADARLEPLQRSLREALRFPVQEGELARCIAWRERRNLDLVLVPLKASEDGPVSRALCVEVKIKSIPTPDQLLRYKDKLAAGLSLDLPEEYLDGEPRQLSIPPEQLTCTLLSPRNVLPEVPPWAWTSWQALAEPLASWAACSDKLSNAIMDYARSLTDLMGVIAWVQQFFDSYRGNSLSLQEALSSIRSQLHRHRLHDLGLKYFFSLLEEVLRQHCVDLQPKGWSIDTYTGYSNGAPMLGIEWVKYAHAPKARGKNDKLISTARIGVQIQGGGYRHLIAVPSDFVDLELVCSKHLLDSWFKVSVLGQPLRGVKVKVNSGQDTDSAPECFTPPLEIRKQPRYTNLHAYNTKRFLYSTMDCGAAPIEKLKEQASESMKLAAKLCQEGGPMLNLSDSFLETQPG
jgi:hypothetical protein